MSRNLNADQDNQYLEIGRLIDETTFSRNKKKIYLPDVGAQVDMIIKKDGKYCLVEIKKSSKKIEANTLQLKYYLYLFYKKGLIDLLGILKIPKEKKSIDVILTQEDITFIEKELERIHTILQLEKPPQAMKLKVCSKCAHNEFCWS